MISDVSDIDLSSLAIGEGSFVLLSIKSLHLSFLVVLILKILRRRGGSGTEIKTNRGVF